METHTPGPWKWGKGVDDDETRCFVTQDIPGGQEWLIAEIQNGAPGDSLETEEANARLIAAAPDLLLAAKIALRALEKSDVAQDSLAWIKERDVLFAAIQQAEVGQ